MKSVDRLNPTLLMQIAVLGGHAHWIQCSTLSDDGALLATGSADKTIRLWDASKIISDAQEHPEDTVSTTVTHHMQARPWLCNTIYLQVLFACLLPSQ